MRTQKQKIFLFFKIATAFIILVIIGLFSFRNTLLEQLLTRTTSKANYQYDCNFTIKEATFDGLSSVKFSNVVLAPKHADTLFKIQEIETTINFWNLLVGDLQLGTLKINNGYVQLTQKGKIKNFAAFIKKDSTETLSDEKLNYASFAHKTISKLLNLVPTDMNIENLVFKLDDNGKKAKIDIKKLVLIRKNLETAIHVQTNTFSQRWKIKGLADPRNKQADLHFFNMDAGPIRLPYFDERYHLVSTFDSIRLNIDNINKSSGEFHLDGFASISNLKINHPKIARKDVIIKKARFDYRFLLGADFISIDSSSTVQLNKIKLHPYLSYSTEEDTLYRLKVVLPKMKAQDFITSLPEGLFTHFEGMETTGYFDYKLNFKFNKNKPNQLVFDSNIKKDNLRILKYGEANLSKINGEFTYRAIINDVPQRPIFVGAANPYFTPLDQIAPFLQKCVLTSEDPSFFNHRGFINEAFRQSIAKNIKTKKFARGASTISMQLVKNVFLTREKTLSRKLEEILLVYLLENNRIASKERMLEVYFNIIEWGPDVYGIGEASEYYFQKKPIDLTLNECLYLARIIPSPKKFMYHFNTEGNLKDTSKKVADYITNIMMKRGLLTLDDTIYKSQPVIISGRARSLLKITVKDSTKTDSLYIPKLAPMPVVPTPKK
ncbi:transglycosylase domain-containing protein [Flavobacterium sp. UMI-01]|uniref:transglycosylase domain-containing protein n=1 Tax=Flavobacterium sp. UMI-01 TaxID=1441053 RepID=UPI001C7DE5E8|nr:biosynthetic peptidoglycan transglycosylase [Flavobacterium sp. UMI-01]GIZ07746.1 glycosyl transferase [Flavobacterium sp. UMI-01]